MDKAVLLEEEEKKKKPVNNRDTGHQTGETRRTWALWTLFMIACVPVIGAGVQYIRNTQLSGRHVSAKFEKMHAFLFILFFFFFFK